MLLNSNNLWLFRCLPEGINRINEFLKEDMIAIGWKKLGDLSNKDKDSLISELLTYGYSTSNVTVGVLNYFVNYINIGDIAIIPDDDKIYLVRIESDYIFDSSKVNAGYAHQRKVTFLNKNNPINRQDLPSDIQKSLGARNTIANLSHRMDLLKQFIEKGESRETVDYEVCELKDELNSLLPKAIENLKNDIESDDPIRRFNASIEVIKLIQTYK